MNRSKKNINRFFLGMMAVYAILLAIISSLACLYSYREKKSQLLSSIHLSLTLMAQEYQDIPENFWQAYMPIYESDAGQYQIFQDYFADSQAPDLDPWEKIALASALARMRVRDSRIQWIGLYSPNRQTNYMLYNTRTGLAVMDETFPYWEELSQKQSQMEIYPARELPNSPHASRTFAVCGGTPFGMGPGSIIVGYSLNNFRQAGHLNPASLPSLHYYILSSDQLVFDSTGSYLAEDRLPIQENAEGPMTIAGTRYYVKAVRTGSSTSFAACSILWRELSASAHKDTPLLLSLTLFFALLSLCILFFMDRSISREVNVIRQGLDRIADNNLDYRIPTDFTRGGLPEIARNINRMSLQLDENIKKAYYFELKQKDAQLLELQATFHPHFLYNTLEMLRSKSYANGDEETAELISQLSALFRGFINAKPFISLKEELALGSRYLTLLNARYGDQVRTSYDIANELLQYGIIRNVFQILIENYFVHGFRAEQTDSRICFTGRSLSEEDMVFYVEDNGAGMTREELQHLNARIQNPIRHGESSYGLKNLNQRLKLFYGPGYGLHIAAGNNGGIRIEITMKKMFVEEYERLTGRRES